MVAEAAVTVVEQLPLCQRWRERRDRYRPDGERIEPSRYGVDVISDKAAAAFVAEHHYAPNVPPQVLSVGLFDAHAIGAPRLAGVCVFSVSMNQRAIPARAGQPANRGCELGRLVLLDEVPSNGESWFVSRAFRLLRQEKPHLVAVVSYSDPLPRRRSDGSLFKVGHIGTVYQALGARFVGRSSPRTLLIAHNGTVVSERSLSKLRNDERGAGYAYDQLRALGAPAIETRESGAAYVARVTSLPVFRRVAHPGNFTYVWGVGTRRERQAVAAGMPPALPYPKAA